MGYVFEGPKVTYTPSCDLGIAINVPIDDKNIPIWYHGIFSDGKDKENLLAVEFTARLIAAAPKLYEEVEEARAFYCLVRLNLESSEQDENRLKALLKLACNGIKRIERLQGEIEAKKGEASS